MAIIGCAYPWVAKYNFDPSTQAVSYTNARVMAKLVRANLQVNSASDNDFNADDGLAETDDQFQDGQLTLNTDDLEEAISAFILGLQTQSLENVPGITDEGAEEILYNDQQMIPFLGFGFRVQHKRNGVLGYRAIVLRKIQFRNPSITVDTKGKTISWQTPETTAAIMRDDGIYHDWKSESFFTTEAQAIAYIKYKLGVTQASQEGGA